MSKILTVVGATGAQGGSVVTSALKSGSYKVRGITRNVDSAASKALVTQGVEMVAADTNDLASLVKAFDVSLCCRTLVLMLTRIEISCHLCCHRFLCVFRYPRC